MKRRLLFLIYSDPRTSPRPAEAVRIAAGLAAWQQTSIAIYFSGEAVRALGDDAEMLVNGENFTRYLPLLKEAGARLLADQTETALLEEIFQAESIQTW
ncbi:MAG TPA: hypothetical protein VHB20_13475 [Verrucomicrobiae bacterium]|jgi:hypothetical protein|nr:hypothetical protein [Verrucomicrobiae bacterium]